MSVEEQLQKYRSFIAGQLAGGSNAADVAQRLVEMGVSQEDAGQMVAMVQGETAVSSSAEPLLPTTYVTAIVGGLAGALIGGFIWGLVVKVTEYEVGFVAWGIGGLCGFGVLLLSGGRRGVPYQVIAVLSSVLGILIGKYVAFYFVFKEVLTQLGGAAAAATISFFSADVFKLFLEALREMVSGFDILWVILAVATAWGIPRLAQPGESE